MSTDTIETTHVPGPEERKALDFMHGIERPTTVVVRHLVMHQIAPGTWNLLKWSAAKSDWIDGPVTNVTIRDEGLDMDGLTIDDLDLYQIPQEHIVLCPEGVPGAGPNGSWTSVSIDAGGVGSAISDASRFAGAMLAEQFRAAATYDPKVDPTRFALAMPSALVRHGVAGRDLVPKGAWQIVGRPDLGARQIDEELARNAIELEEQERARDIPGGGTPVYLQKKREAQIRARRNA